MLIFKDRNKNKYERGFSIMTPLREKMIRDMQIKGFAEKTQEAYLKHVAAYAKYF